MFEATVGRPDPEAPLRALAAAGSWLVVMSFVGVPWLDLRMAGAPASVVPVEEPDPVMLDLALEDGGERPLQAPSPPALPRAVAAAAPAPRRPEKSPEEAGSEEAGLEEAGLEEAGSEEASGDAAGSGVGVGGDGWARASARSDVLAPGEMATCVVFGETSGSWTVEGCAPGLHAEARDAARSIDGRPPRVLVTLRG